MPEGFRANRQDRISNFRQDIIYQTYQKTRGPITYIITAKVNLSETAVISLPDYGTL